MGNVGKIVIRADAGPKIGAGHVLRMLALGQAWQDRGGEVIFVTCKSALVERLKRENFDVRTIQNPLNTLHADAGVVRDIAAQERACWVVVDGYSFDHEYQKTVGEGDSRLMVVDDFGMAGKCSCDLKLDQNLQGDGCGGGKSLIGPSYALLRREYRCGIRVKKHKKTARTIMVMTGAGNKGAELRNTARKTIIDTGLKWTILSGWTEDLRSWMEGADMAVSAGGSTLYELLRMSVPVICVSVADNQVPLCKALHEAGAVKYLGPYEELDDAVLKAVLNGIRRSVKMRKEMAQAGRKLVDGRGAERVVEELCC